MTRHPYADSDLEAVRLPGLTGRRALVTGGSRGIGRATVRLLAEQGCSVGIGFRAAEDQARAARTEALSAAERAGFPDVEVWCQQGDLSSEADVDELYARVQREFGGLDLFVGNAGMWNADERAIEDLTPEEWERMLAANLTSIFLTTRGALSCMSDGARIVLVSSTAAQRGEALHSHYAASKGAINSFCKSLATELGPRNITVNAVAPGWVDTDMSAVVLRGEDRARIDREIPLRRVAEAEDIAGPICFLLSDLARHVTGEILNVNGGSVLCG